MKRGNKSERLSDILDGKTDPSDSIKKAKWMDFGRYDVMATKFNSDDYWLTQNIKFSM